MATLTLSPRRKAATVLVALGPERAAALLRGLPEDVIAELVSEVADIGQLPPEQVQATLRELAEEIVGRRIAATGGPDVAQDLLARVIGPERASQLADSIGPNRRGPFAYLGGADATVVGRVLSVEPPASVALALAHLRPEVAARILNHLPDDMQSEVAMRIASLEHIHPEVVATVDADFQRRVAPLLEDGMEPVAGIDLLTGILNFSTREREREVLARIEQSNPDLAARIREALFLFEDLALLDDKAIQQVLKAVETRDLATALKEREEGEAVRESILRNLSERARENLLEEMEYIDKVRPADLKEAQKNIVKAVQALEEEGAIVIDRGGDSAAA